MIDGTGPRPDQRAERAEAALAEALAERNRLWDELHREASARHDVERLEAEVAVVTGSLAWRMTAPLRRTKAWAAPRRALAVEGVRRARARLARLP